ncbi:M56 family metallopeptidase [Microlunatus panaciterrae]
MPRAAVVLWQAGSLAALLSVTGAGLLIGMGLLEATLPPVGVVAVQVALLAFVLLVVVRLLWSLLAVARRTALRRRRHRHAVDLLGQVDPSAPLPGVRVLAETLPLAYCLPGVTGSRVVLSEGTLATLTAEELRAVLAHEQAHLRARHDVVLDTFDALHRAFPIAVRSEIPHQQCRLLVEMLADDVARKRVGPGPLARALVAMAGAPVPRAALGVGQFGTLERVERLVAPPDHSRPLAGVVYALALGLLALPPAVLALTS